VGQPSRGVQVDEAEIVITVELEGEHHKVYVRKRPGPGLRLRGIPRGDGRR